MIWVAMAFGVELEATRRTAVDAAIAVAVAEAEQRAASGRAWSATAGTLPQIDLFASASTGAGLTSFGFERPVATQLGAGVTGRWALVDPGGWSGALAAHHTQRGQRALVDWARVMARQEATVAFGALWQATAEEKAWQEAATDAQEAAAGLEELVSAGLRPPADGFRARSQAAQLEAFAEEARGAVVGRCAELQALVRTEVTGTCALVEPEVGPPGTGPEEHPALVAAAAALQAAKAQRASALLARGPRVDATGTLAQYVAGGQEGVGWSAGVEATLPVVSGGDGIGTNRTAVADQRAAKLALERQELDLAAATLAAEAAHRAAIRSLEAQQTALDAAVEALARVEARYREGLEGIEAWQSARRTRDEARVAVARGQVAVLLAVAEVEAVRGVW
jgi:outer membrane protein TolC